MKFSLFKLQLLHTVTLQPFPCWIMWSKNKNGNGAFQRRQHFVSNNEPIFPFHFYTEKAELSCLKFSKTLFSWDEHQIQNISTLMSKVWRSCKRHRHHGGKQWPRSLCWDMRKRCCCMWFLLTSSCLRKMLVQAGVYIKSLMCYVWPFSSYLLFHSF